MPVDYSKWDALELSDDSDIEVHPNVDKRSFIRAKQNQIHQQRIDRKHRITTLKYERGINDGLLLRIDALLAALDSHKAEVQDKKDADSIDEVVFDCLTDVAADTSLGADHPPGAPPGVHTNEQQPTYSKMMGALVDQVKSEVEKTGAAGPARYTAYIREVGSHNEKVKGLQKDLNVELAKLEKEEGSKITSESIHTGFDTSHVAKAQAPEPQATATKTSKQPELLNSGSVQQIGGPPSGYEAGVEDDALNPAPGEDEDDIQEAAPIAKKFGSISYGDYKTSLNFIGSNPAILSEKHTDGLLVEAFTAQQNAKSKKEEDYARQCVHQALLLQYCRQLGKDGVGLFFQRVQTPNHQARKLFLDDVNSTYARIRSRTAELAKQHAEEENGDKEQIQLHAVDPNTKINIVTPPSLDQCQTEDEKMARSIFESFPPALQRALETGSLDRVNEVLGKMSVEEAEEVVEQLGNGGMLSLEEGVIDATTDEGKKTIEEIERTHKMPGQQQQSLSDQDRIVEVEDMD
ncbi:Putative cdc37 domain-containing protein [Septoria linicola]|uniref:Hsp90 chaperone protein kinase-targeting subunit n=1 Tax=Septoria linicola TaxID=215465 RepID=A0A9Q9AU49_9PEZI|nr:putative cdc37 domain-containing protein [Septoria linicola]USW52183.1 Putative cdc37 domain-containing protein [Septoria linicola]